MENNWFKNFFIFGLYHIVIIVILLILIATGVKRLVSYEDHVIRGLAIYSIILASSTTLLYYSSNKGFTGKFSEKIINRLEKYGVVIGVAGSVAVLAANIYYLYKSVQPGYEVFIIDSTFAGLVLILVSLSTWLYKYGEHSISYNILYGVLFVIVLALSYNITLYIYMESFNPSLIVLASQLLFGCIALSILLILYGLEALLSIQESYLIGSTYTVGILLLALYVIQSLTLFATTSILADKISSLQKLPSDICLPVIDKLGLMIISYKLFIVFLILLPLLYLVSVIVLGRKKTTMVKIYE